MANDYLTITTSDGNSYKFKAIGFKPKYSPAKTIEKTASGMLDIVYGNVYNSFQYVLRVPYVAEEIGYGTYRDLVAIYSLNRQGATPSSVFTFTDQWGTAHSLCTFYGELTLEPITTVVHGQWASFIVPIEIVMDNDVDYNIELSTAEGSMYIPLIF